MGESVCAGTCVARTINAAQATIRALICRHDIKLPFMHKSELLPVRRPPHVHEPDLVASRFEHADLAQLAAVRLANAERMARGRDEPKIPPDLAHRRVLRLVAVSVPKLPS